MRTGELRCSQRALCPCVPEQHHGAPLALAALSGLLLTDRRILCCRGAVGSAHSCSGLPSLGRHAWEAVFSLLPSSVLFPTFSIQALHLLSH